MQGALRGLLGRVAEGHSSTPSSGLHPAEQEPQESLPGALPAAVPSPSLSPWCGWLQRGVTPLTRKIRYFLLPAHWFTWQWKRARTSLALEFVTEDGQCRQYHSCASPSAHSLGSFPVGEGAKMRGWHDLGGIMPHPSHDRPPLHPTRRSPIGTPLPS